jgi:hypothetical protein
MPGPGDAGIPQNAPPPVGAGADITGTKSCPDDAVVVVDGPRPKHAAKRRVIEWLPAARPAEVDHKADVVRFNERAGCIASLRHSPAIFDVIFALLPD